MIVLVIIVIGGYIIKEIMLNRKADEIRRLGQQGWNGQPYTKVKTKSGTYAIWKNDKK